MVPAPPPLLLKLRASVRIAHWRWKHPHRASIRCGDMDNRRAGNALESDRRARYVFGSVDGTGQHVDGLRRLMELKFHGRAIAGQRRSNEARLIPFDDERAIGCCSRRREYTLTDAMATPSRRLRHACARVRHASTSRCATPTRRSRRRTQRLPRCLRGRRRWSVVEATH